MNLYQKTRRQTSANPTEREEQRVAKCFAVTCLGGVAEGCADARFHAKGGGLVPRFQHVNLRMVGEIHYQILHQLPLSPARAGA